jgi:hypothetical protein
VEKITPSARRNASTKDFSAGLRSVRLGSYSAKSRSGPAKSCVSQPKLAAWAKESFKACSLDEPSRKVPPKPTMKRGDVIVVERQIRRV